MYIIKIINDSWGTSYYRKTTKHGDTLDTFKKSVAYKFDVESMAELQANALRMKLPNSTFKVIKL